jgi:PAS domain S-box-containing protein
MQQKPGTNDKWEKCGSIHGGGVRRSFSWLRSDLWRIVSFLEASLLILLFWRNARREHELKRHLERVFDQPLIGMALGDLDGNLLHVNSELCSMMGYAVDEMLKMDCKQFEHPDNEKNGWDLFQQIRAGTRASYYIEKPYRRKDGTKMWGRLYVCRLNREGEGPPRLLAMVEDITERKVSEQKLNEAQRRLVELTGRLIQVQDEERRLMARELHDDVGQRLSLLMMQLERVSGKLPAASSERTTLRHVLTDLDELTRDVHELSHQLYSSKLRYIGLKPALRELCRQFASQHGTEISEMLEDVPDLPADVQFCLYRVAQEALNNVGKHSQARQVSVQLGTRPDMVILEITDTGIGFENTVPVEGLGIASMRERLRTAGGDLTITSKPGQGTRLAATVPYEKTGVRDKVA